MLSSLPLTLVVSLLSVSLNVDLALAAPRPSSTAGQSIDLVRRAAPTRNATEWGLWAKNQKEMLVTKYGGGPSTKKRASGTNLIINQNADSSFFGSLAIGTPPVSYNVILDTGSSDLWVADSNCETGCSKVPTFDSTTSSTFQNLSKPFQIQYGSGEAAGSLGQDIVQMAGFSVSNQEFGVCSEVSSGLLNSPVSGLLGLAWQPISSSGAMPLWQTLASSNSWTSPLMSFQLTRFVNDSNAQSLEAGGTFTMGFTNQSLYTGSIDYQNIPNGEVSYWIQTVTGITVQGNSITAPTGSNALAAIDTGTTLVGGPATSIQNIFAQIPGSQALTGNSEGYYSYPCDTQVTVTMSFGGPNWAISPADFKLSDLGNNQCMGAFFELQTGSSAPAWIVGDTFLKNVYSVFRFNPPSVGFAQLSATAIAMNGVNLALPSATIGSAVAVSATGSVNRSHSAASTHRMPAWSTGLVLVGAALLSGAWLL